VQSWFLNLSGFLRLVSNASKAGQSLAAAGAAGWKSRHGAGTAPCVTPSCAVLPALRRNDEPFEQNLLHMVFFANFSLLVVVSFGALG
jgi:hypothetical protein